MARIAGVDLPRHKHIAFALPYLYGVGRALAREICKKANIAPTKMTEELTENEIKRIRELEDQVAAGHFTSLEEALALAVADLMAAETDDLAWAKPYVDEARASLARGDHDALTPPRNEPPIPVVSANEIVGVTVSLSLDLIASLN